MPDIDSLDAVLRRDALRAAQPDLVLHSFTGLLEWCAWFQANNAADPRVTPAMCRQATVLGVSSLHLGHVLPAEITLRPMATGHEVVARGLLPRHRSMLDLIAALHHTADIEAARIYAAEAVTPWAGEMRARYPRFTGSEYVPGGDALPGTHPFEHQDLACLTYAADAFDVVVTQEVLEHLPDLATALAEMARVLRPGGVMLSSMPWHYFTEATTYKARLVDGEIQFIGEPEYHDDPVDPRGVPVFQLPGWDILGMARAAGFARAEFIFHNSAIGGVHGQDITGVFVLLCQK